MSAKLDTSYDPNWQSKYAGFVESAAHAVSRIRHGQRVFVGTGCAQPQELVQALVDRSTELADIEIVHMLTLGEAPYADEELGENFRVNSFFIAENVRDVIQEGPGDYTPILASDIPRLFSSGELPLDAAFIQVTPPDERGMCSLGISVDIVKSAAENAGLVIAQVNPRMPRTRGDSSIHVHDMDVLVPVDAPLLEGVPPEPTEITRKICENVAALIEDGSTVGMGIGRIPQAVPEFLKGKKDLGIHTEMFTETLVDLVESGVVTGARKHIDRGKVVTSFVLGSRRLYDYIDNNPVFAFHPSDYVCDPHLIGRQHKQVAINAALEVDLTGQVCSDSLGTEFYSGIGGHADFQRGTARSPGGKAIIALPSTAQGGEVSRIVVTLSPGGGVTTIRANVHYVVTEYGVAYIRGQSVRERALALISIAHPKFRPQLLHQAIKAKYVGAEMADVEGRIAATAPSELRTILVLNDGTQVNFRPMHPTDEPRVRDLFYALSQQTVYYRYMTYIKRIPQKQMQHFVYVDHRTEVAIVATVPEAHGEDMIAVGRYYLDAKTNRAEVAFVVRDAWQGRGIGTFLLKHLITIARRNGIAGFTAEVLRENKAMQHIFNDSGTKVSSRLSDNVYSFELEFE